MLRSLVLAVLLLHPLAGNAEKLYYFRTGKEAGLNPLAGEKIDEYYRTILSMSSRLQYLSPEDARASAAEGSKPVATRFNPVLDEANGLLSKGKGLLAEKKWDAAAEPLNQALEIYAENYDILRDMDNLVDATFSLSVAYFMGGYADNADEMLQRTVVLRPDLNFDRAVFSKEFVAAFEAARAAVMKKHSGSVTIEVTDGPAQDVYLDGVLRGKTPLTLKELLAGVHYVQVFAPAKKPWGNRFKAPKAGQSKTIKARLVDEEAGAAVAAGPAGSGDEARLAAVADSGEFAGGFKGDARAFAGRVGADFLLYTYVHRDGQQYQLNQFLYSAKADAVADVGFAMFDNDLSDLQIKVLILEDQLYTAVTGFAGRKVVTAVPECYRKKAPEPAVAVLPAVVPGTAGTGAAGAGSTATSGTPGGSVTSPVVKGGTTSGAEPGKPRFKIIPYNAAGGTAGATPSGYTEQKAGPAWYKNKWVWIGVGAAAVLTGAGVGTYFLLQKSSGGGGYKVSLTW